MVSHLLPLLLLIVPIFWGLYGYIKTRRETKQTFERIVSPWPLIINSAVLYALAFNIIFFIQELFLALGKKWLGLKAYLYHNNHNWEDSHPMDDLAQGYGATAIFITGVICLFIARRIKLSTHWLQLFFLWLAFEGLAQSLPQFITAANSPTTDTGQAFAYLGIPDKLGLLISVTGILLMLLISMSYSRYLLQFSPSDQYVTTASRRFRYLLHAAVIASLVGIVLIIPFRIMPWDRVMAPVMVTLISVPMVFANAWHVKAVDTINSRINQKIFAWPIIFLIILLLIFQLVLAKGVVV
jgi:hypothetical protein